MTTTLHPAVAADRRSRRNKKLDFWLKFAAHITAVIIAGWLFMLAVGNVRADWLPWLPTLGFSKSVLIAGLLRGALAPIPWPKDEQR